MTLTRIFDIPYITLEKFPKKDYINDKIGGSWRNLSTEDFIAKSNQFSRGLIKLGLKKGDKIGLITTTNRTEWCIIDQAALQLGIITVPIYPSISQADCVYNLGDSDSLFCFVSDEKLFNKINEIRDQLPLIKEIYTFDKVNAAKHWEDILELGKDDSLQAEVDDIKKEIYPDDLVSIIYTSGTTGKPKGVMLTHNNIVQDIIGCEDRIPRRQGNDSRALSFLPMCHVFERMIFYLFTYNGFAIYFAESTDKLSENLQEVKPHYMTVVPRVIEKVYDSIYKKGTEAGGIKKSIFLWSLKIAENYKLGAPKSFFHKIADKLVFSKWRAGIGGNILTLVSGSAPLSTRLNIMFQAAGIPIQEGYGLTETSPVISVNSFEFMKMGSIGKPLFNVNVKIAEDGEITVKGPTVTQGYYKNPELTKDAFDNEGYFKTGDIGHLDKDGFLFITDRKKEMFKTSGGKYVAPQVIENLAKASLFIEQIMVVGEGEKMPTALIQPDFDYAKKWAKDNNVNIGTTPEEIAKSPELKAAIEKEMENINKNLGHWEQIKKIELTPEIWSEENGMLTPTLKLKRKVIKEHFMDLYNKLYDR
ncbi:long-chain acyl-CoA synthetase [Soonwooa buanensis]|uniref:Long-chain acyl-CoA synthetase n=1 Tax=Soonwooa buanensis TaxID=619805 RepID=A0A1T5F6Q7_9FLAO|nr:long-chain fatty acid--CoA ligase [Soonwooa buanensis]SKB91857.1 long-chain acyl-CoA synthetase [Soonwooa buanensis]